MADIDIARLKELEAKATPDKWVADTAHKQVIANGKMGSLVATTVMVADASYITALRNAAPALIEAYEQRDQYEYLFACVLDYATGGRASKPYDKDTCYNLIGEHVERCESNAVKEATEELRAQLRDAEAAFEPFEAMFHRNAEVMVDCKDTAITNIRPSVGVLRRAAEVHARIRAAR